MTIIADTPIVVRLIPWPISVVVSTMGEVIEIHTTFWAVIGFAKRAIGLVVAQRAESAMENEIG
jgi:hypothetical protein